MPIQAPQWTEFLSCPVCYNVFSEKLHRPISLACGHTVCKSCLSKLQQSKCPFDQSLITRDVSDLPVNFALLQLVCATAVPENKERGVPKDCRKYYEDSKSYIEVLALLLKPVSSATTGSIIPPTSSSSGAINTPTNCVLSRPMQRKLITLVNCQLVEEEGRSRAVRAARSLGERTVTELILQHQNPQQLSSNLWAAVRGRGCQFLGPAMQEEVLRLILLALEDGSALSRKVLVLFVVQRLECQYPQASKTAIGHVVQLLYRASCFKVTKRDQESSLMQLKEEYRSYETLRREHDTQIVQIAMEAGLRIAPDQWSSLLYGDSTHKSHMQSIIDKLQTPQTFCQSVSELLIALQRTGDPHSLQRLTPQLEFLSSIDPSPDVPCPSWENLEGVLKAAKTVVEGLVTFLQNSGHKKHDFLTPFNNVRYKTSMCRDFAEKGNCPRGSSCTFAHSEEELERHRQRNKKIGKGVLGLSTVQPPAHGVPDNRLNRATGSGLPDNRLNRATGSAVPANVPPGPRTPVNRATGPTKTAGKQEQDNLSHRSSDSEDMINSMQQVNMQANTPQGAAGYSPMVAMVMPNSHQNQPIPPTQQPPPNAPVPVMPQMNMPPVYRGQTPQPGEIPPPPVMPPQPQPHPHYDLMAFPGALMGQGKYPIPPPMNPMMYMYPGMSPYMPYYHPGYMPQGGMRYHFDGYRTPLNPYAEPWNPHSQQQMNNDYAAMGGPSTLDAVPNVPCSVCSHRNQQDSVVMASQGDPYISQTVTMSTVTCTASATDTYQASLTDNVNSSVASVVSTSDALINRQSLSNLQERRNSLLAIMKERQRNPNSTEEARLRQSTGMASYKDLIERMTQQSCPTSDHDHRERTLEHPVPRDAGPPGLRSTFVNQKGLFERLGALSGMPPSSVNDSIMASWMTATLSASETSNNKKASTVYSSASETPPPVSSVTYSNTSNSIGWNSSANQSAASSSVGKAYGLEETSWNGLEEDYPYWQDVVQTTESPPPSTGALRSLLNQPEFSSFNNSIAQSIMSSLSYSTFLSDMDQEEVIPFDPPIISKFGPISRTKYTKNNDTVPLKVTADEMIKTIPVTAVTPLSRPPLPNAATVPSRFTPTSVDPVSVSAKTMYEPEPYSLWKQEVIQLEQKAQEANTEDERLSVELQAVEMQISMKQQQLQDAHDVQQEQRQASEYIRHRNNTRPDRAQWTDQ